MNDMFNSDLIYVMYETELQAVTMTFKDYKRAMKYIYRVTGQGLKVNVIVGLKVKGREF